MFLMSECKNELVCDRLKLVSMVMDAERPLLLLLLSLAVVVAVLVVDAATGKVSSFVVVFGPGLGSLSVSNESPLATTI